jgi:ketosteroid isomerase-like protein
MEDRREATRDVMRRLDMGPHWLAVMDPGMPAELDRLTRRLIEIFRDGDLDSLLAHTDPRIEIVQVPEVADAGTHHGHDGLIDVLLDWPRQWRQFRMEPRRIFAAGENTVILVALHKGQPQSMEIDVEAEFVSAFRWRDGLVTRWDMFMTVEEALSRAAESGAHRDDDHAAEGDGGEGAQEAGPEEARADHR